MSYYDCSADQAAYGAQVAALSRALNALPPEDGKPGASSLRPGKSGTSSAETGYVAVLCRTDGREVDFDCWKPSVVVGGPYHCYTLYFSNEILAAQALKELPATPGVRYAERDAEVHACGDAEYEFYSWGAETMHYGSYLGYSSAWGSGSAAIAIVDSGVSLHPMLAGRILESGYDYIDGDTDATNDLFGHGTNVAGIVADCSAGQAVTLYPIRVLNSSGGGSLLNVINAVREATEKGVDVINLSLESSALSEGLDDAILDAVRAGVVVVCAAGNKTINTSQISPAHLTNLGVIVVGSAESNGSRSYYSNYGDSVDVYAYGSGIVCCSRSGGFTSATGTSMAAPHISALAAMLRLIHGGISPESIELRITRAADTTAELAIPDLTAMIPQRLGFRLTTLWLASGEQLQLPRAAFPRTALEGIRYESSDPAVLSIENGRLIPQGVGTATVTAQCTGFETQRFTVEIRDSYATLTVPEGLSCIEDEAFAGNGAVECVVLADGIETLGDGVLEGCENLKTVFLPDSLLSVGEHAIPRGVIVCAEGSEGERYASENGLDYVIQEAA